jgi:hypothetical protein
LEGDRRGALDLFERAAETAPEATNALLAWATRSVDGDSVEGRRRACVLAAADGIQTFSWALERFALEAQEGKAGDAEAALVHAEGAAAPAIACAAALARLIWPDGAANAEALAQSLETLRAAGAGPLAAAEAHRMSLGSDPDSINEAARAWSLADAGGAAALEWLAATLGLPERPELRIAALRALAQRVDGDAGAALHANAAVATVLSTDRESSNIDFVAADSAPARLANLELAPFGSLPERRAFALCRIGDALGEQARLQGLVQGGWAQLASGDVAGALETFGEVCATTSSELGAWEGLRASAACADDASLRALAAAELGARCANAARGAAFWEEAGDSHARAGDGAAAEFAFAASFDRDPSRATAFDKLFRRVRDQKQSDRILDLIARRLAHTDDVEEMATLFWEQARAFREKGDNDSAMEALENVDMIEPDHVGALALSGEIAIRRGNYGDAADKLSRLASLETAPAKNRLTAGVAAADLFENKLMQPPRALAVLLGLHRAGLSTLPVRERLAKIAARSESWAEAASILDGLMAERSDTAGRIDAARLLMAIARDRLGDTQRAAPAAAFIVQNMPEDGDAIDLILDANLPSRSALLQSAREAICATLAASPTSPDAAERLSRVARALGEPMLEDVATSLARVLAGPNLALDQALSRTAGRRPRGVPPVRVSPTALGALLAPGDAGPLSQLFEALGPTLAEAFGPTLESLGVTKRDRVDAKSGLALRGELAGWAAAFGISEIDVYVGGRDPSGISALATAPPALVVGSALALPLSAAVRAKIASELLGLVRGTTLIAARDASFAESIVAVCCNLSKVPLPRQRVAPPADVERLLTKTISRKTRAAIAGACAAIATTAPDVSAWTEQVALSRLRCAALFTGEVAGVVEAFQIEKAAEGRSLQKLCRFVLSAEYLDTRRALGLGGAQ